MTFKTHSWQQVELTGLRIMANTVKERDDRQKITLSTNIKNANFALFVAVVYRVILNWEY